MKNKEITTPSVFLNLTFLWKEKYSDEVFKMVK